MTINLKKVKGFQSTESNHSSECTDDPYTQFTQFLFDSIKPPTLDSRIQIGLHPLEIRGSVYLPKGQASSLWTEPHAEPVTQGRLEIKGGYF